MCHCHPTPPNCEPGQVYNAICPPGPAELGAFVLILALVVGTSFVVSRYAPDAGAEE